MFFQYLLFLFLFVLGAFDVSAEAPQNQFVFVLPPASFVNGVTAIAVELYKRGNRVVFATLDGYDKKLQEQLSVVQLTDEQKERLISPETISMGPMTKLPTEAIQAASKNPSLMKSNFTAARMAGEYYLSLFQTILDGIDSHQEELGDQHPFYSKDSLYVLPGSFHNQMEFALKRGLPFAAVFPAAGLSSAVSSPIFVPPLFLDMPLFNKTLFQRVKCAFASFMINIVYGNLIPFPFAMMDTTALFKKPILKIVTNIPSATTLKPYTPLTVFTGPVVSTERKDPSLLPPRAAELLATGTPVVYMSFGTYADLDAETIDFLVRALTPGHREWGVVWALPKSQSDSMTEETLQAIAAMEGAFVVEPWVNTPSVLAHPNTKLFVSHCGGNGMSESEALGVPVLGFPLFGDQPANCKSAEENTKNAICRFLDTATVSEINNDIASVMADPDNHLTIGAKNLQILINKGYGGTAAAADWLEIAAALKGDMTMLESPVEREGVVKSYCLDLLGVGLVTMLMVGFCAGRCSKRDRPYKMYSKMA